MMLINRSLFYKIVILLKSKSADVTLNIFETYYNKAKCQTRKKLKQIRLNMRKE